MARTILPLLIALCALPAAAAQPQSAASPFSGNLLLANDYVYRGLTNTEGDPTIQGTLEYTHPSGFHAGIFGSNTSAPEGSIEIDLYAGWRFQASPDLGFDFGLQRYAFPGHAPAQGYAPGTTGTATTEAYVATSWRWLSLKYSHAITDAFGHADSRGSDYLDLTLTAPLGDSGFSVTAHAGRQRFKSSNAPGWTPASGCSNRCLSYTDTSLGVDKVWKGLDFGLVFSHANTRARAHDGSPVYLYGPGDNLGGNRWIFSVAKSF